jgi:hypothetical protein
MSSVHGGQSLFNHPPPKETPDFFQGSVRYVTHHLILLKITSCQLPVTKLTHKFLEIVEVDIGADSCVGEDGDNCVGSWQRTLHAHFLWMEGLHEQHEKLQQPTLMYPVADVSQQVKPSSITKPCHVQDVRVFGNNCFRPLTAGHCFLHIKRMEFLVNSNMVRINPSFTWCPLTWKTGHTSHLRRHNNFTAEALKCCHTSCTVISHCSPTFTQTSM